MKIINVNILYKKIKKNFTIFHNNIDRHGLCETQSLLFGNGHGQIIFVGHGHGQIG
jgi:hypothetical protein